jgi:hypothetical protein
MKIHILHTQIDKETAQELTNPLNVLDVTQLATFELLCQDEACVILYQNPTELMAGFLRTGFELTQVILLYKNALNFLIKTFKSSRPNIRLLAMDATNTLFENELGEFNQTINSLLNSLCVDKQDVYDLAAGFLLTQNRPLLKLSQQLAACSIVAFENIDVDVTEVLNNHVAVQRISAKVRTELKQVNTQNLTVLRRLEEVEERLKVAQLEEAKLKNEVDNQIKLVTQKHELNVVVKSELKDVVDENKELLTKIHEIQEDLEEFEIDFSKAKSDEVKKIRELEKKEQQMIRESISKFEKVTNENGHNLKQLHHSQELLESCYLLESKMKSEMTMKTQELGVFVGKLNATENAFEREKATKIELVSKLKGVVDENKELLTKFHEIQEDLEKFEMDFSKVKSDEVQRVRELEKKEQQMIRESISKFEKVSNENDHILEQLHHSQELLESCYLLETKMKSEMTMKAQELGVFVGKLNATENAFEREKATKIEMVSKLKDREKQQLIIEADQQDIAKYNTWLKLLYTQAQKARYKVNFIYRGILKKQSILIQSSEMFDSEWYLSNYPNIRKLGIDPALHYLQIGAAQGLNPSSSFNTLSYVFEYSDVAKSCMNPLVHFLNYGILEGREADPRRKLLSGPTNQEH